MGSGSIPTLRTDRLVLRPFELGDAPVVQRLAGDREVASTTLNIPHPYEDGVAEAWIETHLPAWREGSLLALAITTDADGVVGGISLHLNAAHRRGELGYWIGVPYWSRGYATEASRALVEHGFEELSLNRIVAQHITRNPASGRVMEKVGMRREGLLREHLAKWDQLEDVAVYGVLRGEFGGR